MPTRRSLLVLVATGALIAAGPVGARDKSIVVASTTSTQDSGLFGHILPLFKAKTGIDVKVVAQGTGQALDTGRRGDADVLFVHAKAQEAALNTASAANAYVLADRGTWLSFKNRGDLDILVAGDKRLFNQYGVILVNPEKHPHVKKVLGQAFIDWLVSPKGQKAIADYKINGQELFFPNASVPGA